MVPLCQQYPLDELCNQTVGFRCFNNVVEYCLEVAADYSELGWLLITVALLATALPLLTILVVQSSPWRTQQ